MSLKEFFECNSHYYEQSLLISCYTGLCAQAIICALKQIGVRDSSILDGIDITSSSDLYSPLDVYIEPFRETNIDYTLIYSTDIYVMVKDRKSVFDILSFVERYKGFISAVLMTGVNKF